MVGFVGEGGKRAFSAFTASRAARRVVAAEGGSGVRGQGSGVRGQGSGSGVKGQGSGERGQGSGDLDAPRDNARELFTERRP